MRVGCDGELLRAGCGGELDVMGDGELGFMESY